MFLLLDNNVIVDQNLYIQPLLNRLGFLSHSQYYNWKLGKTKKFDHLLNRFKILNINQQEFFSDNMLWCPELEKYHNYL
jgi:hypothetical protein